MPDQDPSAPPQRPHSAGRRRGLSALAWRLRWLAHGLRLSLRLPRVAGRVFLLCWICVALLFLAVRHIALPQVAGQRDRIVAELSQALGLKLAIAAIDADWPGWRPVLQLRGVQVFDAAGREVLALSQVDASVAWASLLNRRLELASLTLVRPDLSARREADGRIFIAGLPVEGGGDGAQLEQLLHQHEIVIADGRVTWIDLQRAAPELVLEKLALRLQSRGEVHRFALSAQPAGALSGPLEVRGDLRGARVSQLDDWRGSLFVDMRETDLAVWRRWVDYPVRVQQGRGSLRAWLNFEGGRVASLTTDLALAGVETQLASDLPVFALKSLSGRLRFSVNGDDYAFSAERLRLLTRNGLEVLPTQLSLRHNGERDAQRAGGSLSGERLDMGVIAQLAAYLPLPESVRTRLQALDPHGLVQRLAASWEDPPGGKVGMPPRFELDASVSDIAVRSADGMPGLAGFSGRVQGNEQRGEFSLSLREGALELPAIFREARVAVTQAQASGQWERHADGELSVRVPRLQLDNDDARGAEFAAVWRGQPGSAGRIDLTGSIRTADPRAVWRYIPSVVPADVSDWLKAALTAGQGEDLRVRLAGELDAFPFSDAASRARGLFRIEGKVAGVDLAFAPGWPALQNLQGRLLFERAGMQIKVSSGHYGKVRLREVSAHIADLENASKLPLDVTGVAEGPAEQMLDYLRATPIARHLGSFIQHLRVGGDARLDLKLAIPLLDAENTRVQGGVQLDDNVVQLARSLPPMQHVRATLGFNEIGLLPTEARGEFLGGRFSTSGKGLPDGTAVFDASGVFPARGLNDIVPTPLWQSLSGETAVSTKVRVSSTRAEVLVQSDLAGIRSSLPPPMDKAASTLRPLSFTWASYDEPGVRVPGGASLPSIEDWQLGIEGLGAAHWQDRCVGEQCEFVRGAAGLNDSLSLPARGMRVSGRFASLDIDAWRPVLSTVIGEARTRSKGGSLLAGAALQADEIIAGGHRFAQVSGRALQQDGRWVLRLQGPDAAGDLTWFSEGKGRLQAQLSVLRLKPVESRTPAAEAAAQDENLPALDIAAQAFELNGMKLGALTLAARNEGSLWRLPVLRIESADGVITGDGLMRGLPGGGKQTEVSLRLHTDNAGAMLGRLGFADALRKGEATLAGRLSWNAAATAIDYSSLSGTLRLDAENGQFNKLEPGAGRLLGVLSLQSLPRRISLDFRDVFSDGFAFDAITGDMQIDKGVLHTNNLVLRGPAAKAYMTGTTDLGRETHALRVTVQPTLSEGVAVGLGAVVLNPVVGVAVYLTQKALSDPLEKLFSFEYSISGPWAEPRIDKLGSAGAQSAPQPK